MQETRENGVATILAETRQIRDRLGRLLIDSEKRKLREITQTRIKVAKKWRRVLP